MGPMTQKVDDLPSDMIEKSMAPRLGEGNLREAVMLTLSLLTLRRACRARSFYP